MRYEFIDEGPIFPPETGCTACGGSDDVRFLIDGNRRGDLCIRCLRRIYQGGINSLKQSLLQDARALRERASQLDKFADSLDADADVAIRLKIMADGMGNEFTIFGALEVA